MKGTIFNTSINSSKLSENLNKQFGVKVSLDRYNREQLEDMRNKLRTRIFQYEGSSRFNDLLQNESYQKDKAMLELLNTRIKEMLGEQMKQLRDKLDQLNEGKKGVKVAKHPQGSKKATKDYDGDGKVETPKDEVWGSRAKAAAKAGKPFSEAAKPDFLDMDKDGNKKEPMKKAVKDKKVKEAQGEADDKDRKPAKTKEREVTLPSGAKVKSRTVQGWQSQKADKEAGKDKNKDLDEAEDRLPAKKAASTWTDKSGKKHPSTKVQGHQSRKADKEADKEKKKDLDESKLVFKRNVRLVNESLARYIAEDEEGKAKAITAAGDMVNDFTSWMQRVGQYQTKTMIELADAIKADFGAQEAEQFKQAVAPALASALETLTAQREAISNAVAVLAGEATAAAPMGMEPEMGPEEPGMDMAGPDTMNPEPAGDEFAAADAAAGGPEAAGRAMRESKEQRRARRLAEAHNIIAKLAK
jgi:hypothetical protein